MTNEQIIIALGVLGTFLYNAVTSYINYKKVMTEVLSQKESFSQKQEEFKQEHDLELQRLSAEAPDREAKNQNIMATTYATALDSLRKEMKEREIAHERDRSQLREELKLRDARHEMERTELLGNITKLRKELSDRDIQHAAELTSYQNEIISLRKELTSLKSQIAKYTNEITEKKKTGPLPPVE